MIRFLTKRTNLINDWLQRVQALETEVQKILDDNEAIKIGGGCYFCCRGGNNCLSAYQLGKLVVKKMKAIQDLLEGDFQYVTYRCQPDPLQQIPTVEVVGMDAEFNEVLEYLITDINNVGIIGLYGMGGVGKTTLIQKVNNECVERKQFDVVIFAVVSKNLNLKSIQNLIGTKLGVSWTEETQIYDRANHIFKLLKYKKILLLLDDNTVQITGSKIAFTTRDKQVCGFMEADKRIKIGCKVKQEALSCHPDVHQVARNVAKECRGLPLALIAIGRTMSSKTDLHQWQHALHTPQESASHFSGMADKVLSIMKFSYDNLENQKLKSCFLYCSLYPEDWLLDNVSNLVKARNEGHDVIRCLKDAGLLETGLIVGLKMEGLVKTHDVVRDLAIWVSSDLGRKKNTYLTLQAETITLKLHEWEKAERISLIEYKEIKILDGAPNCLNLKTLFLQNSSISIISEFRCFPMLKVLHMDNVKLKKLPTSIFSLLKLQSLNMPECDEDVLLTPGSLASLSKLKFLCLSESCCHWEVEGGPSLCELESLQHLISLRIIIRTGLALQRFVTSPKLQLCTKFLIIKYCPGITSLTFLPSSAVSLLSLVHMIHLNSLELKNCVELEELRIMSRDKVTLLTTLEELFISYMPKLRIAWDMPRQSLYSVNLKRVLIRGCPQLKDINICSKPRDTCLG
ncbi:hypothetical protein MKX01_012508 [Papaver californicum]|nr:hypothetical protein MKX01_012508 [Papaver californicum]